MRCSACLLLFISLAVLPLRAQQPTEQVKLIFYNVENFFDARHDTLKNDYEFLPEGSRHWTYTRYERKAERVAQVLANIGGFSFPLLVGLCEVENDECARLLCRKMSAYPYRYVHAESADQRGIDVCLLYDSTHFMLLDTAALRVDLQDAATRDILYAAGRMPSGDTLHVFVCHLPSMRGGKAASDWKRQKAKQVLQQHIDVLLSCSLDAKIVVMGDMNDAPKNDLSGLNNCMMHFHKSGQGTEKYQGRWSCLDQFYVSASLDTCCDVSIYDASWLLEQDERYGGTRPKRTFTAFRYNKDGYSDHLPIVLDLRFQH